MKRIICTLLIVLVLFSGCTPTRNLYPLNSEKCAEINEKAAGQGATLTINGVDDEVEAEYIRVKVDSSYWIDEERQADYFAQNEVIEDITITDHEQGLLYGGIAGLIIGGVIILAAYNADYKSGTDEDMAKAFLGILGIGACVGVAAGSWIRGVDYRYTLYNPHAWTDFQRIEHLIETDNEDSALDKLNKIINESQEDRDITIALYLKIKHGLGDPLEDYQNLKTGYPNNIYTSLAAELLVERGVAEPKILTTGQTKTQEFSELAQKHPKVGYHQHDGFFLRFHAGLGSGDMTVENYLGSNRTQKGSTGAYRFQIGATIAENLVLYADFGEFDIYASGSGWETYMGTSEEVDLFVFNYGAGLSYYFMPANYYLSGGLSLCTNKIRTKETQVENTTDSGWGLYFSAGKEWWVSENWGLGLAGFAHYSQTSGVEPSQYQEYKINNTVFGVVFSATYH